MALYGLDLCLSFMIESLPHTFIFGFAFRSLLFNAEWMNNQPSFLWPALLLASNIIKIAVLYRTVSGQGPSLYQWRGFRTIRAQLALESVQLGLTVLSTFDLIWHQYNQRQLQRHACDPLGIQCATANGFSSLEWMSYLLILTVVPIVLDVLAVTEHLEDRNEERDNMDKYIGMGVFLPVKEDWFVSFPKPHI
jgi:hypothetical protein